MFLSSLIQSQRSSMSPDIKDIFRFLDGEMDQKESDKFSYMIENDMKLKEYVMQMKETDEFLSGRFSIRFIEDEPDFDRIFIETREDVKSFLHEGKTDLEVLSYLNSALLTNDIGYQDFIDNTEQDQEYKKTEEEASTFVHEFTDEKNLDQSIFDFVAKADKSIKEKHRDYDVSKMNARTAISKKIYLWSVSAAAVLLLFLVFIFSQLNTPVHERLLSDYHETPFELTGIQVRSESAELNSVFSDALELYRIGAYQEASKVFYELYVSDVEFEQAFFYSAVSDFEAGNYKKAEQSFINIISEYDAYDIESKWLLSLCYILNEKQTLAEPLLKELGNQKSLYQSSAQKLYKELK
jgi:TolA-binding protein